MDEINGYDIPNHRLLMDLIEMESNFTDSYNFTNFSLDFSTFDINTLIVDHAAYDVLKLPAYKIPVIIVYSVVVLFGSIGNSLVVLTVAKTKAMWTATNIFIANLALADVFVCVLDLPSSAYYQLTDDWIFGETLCHVIPMLLGIVVYSSTLTLTMIAIDRYILIMFPLGKKMTMRIVVILLTTIIILSIALASPVAIYSKYTEWDDFILGIHRRYCIENWPTTELRKAYTISMLIAQYLLPLTLIAALYTRIFCQLQHRMSSKRSHKRRARTTKMLLAVVIIFALTWTPFHVHSVLLEFKLHPLPSHYFKFTDAILRALALSSSCINPLLYGWLNENFRTAFLSIIKKPNSTTQSFHRESETDVSRKSVLIPRLHVKRRENQHNGITQSCFSTDNKTSEAIPLRNVIVHMDGTSHLKGRSLNHYGNPNANQIRTKVSNQKD